MGEFSELLEDQRRLAGVFEAEETPQEAYLKQVAATATSIEKTLAPLFKGSFFRVEHGQGILVEFGRLSPDDYAKEQLRTNYNTSPNNHIRMLILPSKTYPSPGWTDLTVKLDTLAHEDQPDWIVFRKQTGLSAEKAEAAVVKWFKENATKLQAGGSAKPKDDKPRDVTPVDPVFGKVISSYSRKQALSDGVLIDVSKDAKEAGFKWPVAITVGVKGKLTPKSKGTGQSFEGRLWDLLNLMRFAAKKGGTEIFFVAKMGKTNEKFKMVSGPGDDGEPVITVMLPGED